MSPPERPKVSLVESFKRHDGTVKKENAPTATTVATDDSSVVPIDTSASPSHIMMPPGIPPQALAQSSRLSLDSQNPLLMVSDSARDSEGRRVPSHGCAAPDRKNDGARVYTLGLRMPPWGGGWRHPNTAAAPARKQDDALLSTSNRRLPSGTPPVPMIVAQQPRKDEAAAPKRGQIIEKVVTTQAPVASCPVNSSSPVAPLGPSKLQPRVPRKPLRFIQSDTYRAISQPELLNELAVRHLSYPATPTQQDCADTLIHNDGVFHNEFNKLQLVDNNVLRDIAIAEYVPIDLTLIYHPIKLAEMIAEVRARKATAQWISRAPAKVVAIAVTSDSTSLVVNRSEPSTIPALPCTYPKRKSLDTLQWEDISHKKPKVDRGSINTAQAARNAVEGAQPVAVKRNHGPTSDFPVVSTMKLQAAMESIEKATTLQEIEMSKKDGLSKATKKLSKKGSTTTSAQLEKVGSAGDAKKQKSTSAGARMGRGTESSTLSSTSSKPRASVRTDIPQPRRITRSIAPKEEPTSPKKKKLANAKEGYYWEPDFIDDGDEESEEDQPRPKKKRHATTERIQSGLCKW